MFFSFDTHLQNSWQCHVRELNIGKCSLPIATHGLPTQANDEVSVFKKIGLGMLIRQKSCTKQAMIMKT
jgi:hypothetical protein